MAVVRWFMDQDFLGVNYIYVGALESFSLREK